MNDISYAIVTLLDERDMSQSELSKKSGVPTSSLSRYLESGDMPASRLIAIARALDVSADELMGIREVLSSDERELLELYRAMDMRTKRAFIEIAHTLSPESSDSVSQGAA